MICSASSLSSTIPSMPIPTCIARISSIILKLSSCPKGSYLDSCSFNNFGIRTLSNELDTVLVSLSPDVILSTSSSSLLFFLASALEPPTGITAAGVKGYTGLASLPCMPSKGFGASSSGYFLNFGAIEHITLFSCLTCLKVPIQGALPYNSSSSIFLSFFFLILFLSTCLKDPAQGEGPVSSGAPILWPLCILLDTGLRE